MPKKFYFALAIIAAFIGSAIFVFTVSKSTEFSRKEIMEQKK